MRDVWLGLVESATAAWVLVLAGASDVGRHWAMAAFSVIAAFGVWFAIQDVENPRVEQTFPADDAPGVLVEAQNVPAGYVFEDTRVHIRVEAREQDFSDLRESDFEAIVDLSDVDPANPGEVEVIVRSHREDVTAIEAIPQTVPVRLVEAVEAELAVSVKLSGSLPDGYELDEDPSVDPAFVTVSGPPSIMNQLASIEIDVNLNGRREDAVVEGDLVARTETGGTLTPNLSVDRARVTLKISQLFRTRTLTITPETTGFPAKGYRVTNVTVDPREMAVNGLESVMQSLTSIAVEPVDVTGATTTIRQTKQIVRVPNTTVPRTTVTVTVEIEPIDCTGPAPVAPCLTASVQSQVIFENQPPGTYVDGVYFATIHVSGSQAQVSALKPSDFRATVSLAGATVSGVGQSFPVTVSGPAGVRIVETEPVVVILRPVPVP